MRNALIILLAFVMIASLTACGAKENNPPENTNPSESTQAYEEKTSETTLTEEEIFTTIEAKDCFDDAGFIELIDGATDPAVFTFTSEDSDNVEWSVYIFDEAFEDGFRFIPMPPATVRTWLFSFWKLPARARMPIGQRRTARYTATFWRISSTAAGTNIPTFRL